MTFPRGMVIVKFQLIPFFGVGKKSGPQITQISLIIWVGAYWAPGNFKPFFKGNMFVSFHGNTLSRCCTSFVNLALPTSRPCTPAKAAHKPALAINQ